MTATTNYAWDKPTVGADDDTWGTTLNATIDDIDTDLKAVSDAKNTLTTATFSTSLKHSSQGSVLWHGSSTYASGKITVSTADASGTPADGDIWIKYTP
jgi:hypothetical protein